MHRPLLGALALLLSALAVHAAEPPVRKQIFLSKVYDIDKKYRSMEGPGSIDTVFLGDPNKPELLWVTAIRTEMVKEDGVTPQLPELMCHVNVDVDSEKHSALFNLKRYTATRLITLSQGMLDARFPEGFGYPLASNEPLSVFTQVLNLNIEHPVNLKVRHRITFEYVRDADLEQPLKPLFNVGASGTVILPKEGASPMAMPDMAMAEITGPNGQSEHGVSCIVAARAPNATKSGMSDYTDPQGRKVTGHWVVPPGRQVNHSDITWFMQLPVDTKLHWAAAHLHPFAKSLSIIDATTGQTVFEVKAKGPEKGIGLTHVDTFSSIEGVPMYRDHKYELISVYDNPTSENSDSMASAFLALDDPDFVRPDAATLAARAEALVETSSETTAVVRTNIGDFEINFFHDESPNTVRNFIRLARTGAFSGAILQRAGDVVEAATAPTTDAQRAVLLPFVHEAKAQHAPGVLATCANSPTTFTIELVPAPDRDSRCTPFARVTLGSAVVRAMTTPAVDGTPARTARIEKVDVYGGPQNVKITLAPLRTVPQS